jgi:hypothetical protein
MEAAGEGDRARYASRKGGLNGLALLEMEAARG